MLNRATLLLVDFTFDQIRQKILKGQGSIVFSECSAKVMGLV